MTGVPHSISETQRAWGKGLRERSLLGVRGKDTAIGSGIEQVFHGRIGGDPSQAKAKGRARVWRRQGRSQGVKEHAHGGHAQLVAALTEGSGGGTRILRLAGRWQSFLQTTPHFTGGTLGGECQRDDQGDHGWHVQVVLALLPGLTAREYRLDHVRGMIGSPWGKVT